MRLFASVLAAAAALVTQIVPVLAHPAEGLAGSRWAVETLNGDAMREPFGAPKLTFSPTHIHVNSGCRPFRAALDGDGDTHLFRIEPDPMIAIACADYLEKRQWALARVVGEATRIEREGDRLSIATEDGETLEAVRLD